MGALNAQMQDNKRTHWMAWTLVVCCLAGAVLFGLKENTTLAVVFLSTPLLGAATAFLRGRIDKKDDLPKK